MDIDYNDKGRVPHNRRKDVPSKWFEIDRILCLPGKDFLTNLSTVILLQQNTKIHANGRRLVAFYTCTES